MVPTGDSSVMPQACFTMHPHLSAARPSMAPSSGAAAETTAR
eukprot:CAMPEP_0194698540 /NCGR_PEP_ID=MMETSP0295-20121207/24168_1 /TAXON_ID=39354 /ORGANISM="Heterosigma akashiwo, Strain CCMP2393" /LENGTH=41 /DNA_ID= /DNA_START= /DNA_END= /DNA_ORIENTATION=